MRKRVVMARLAMLFLLLACARAFAVTDQARAPHVQVRLVVAPQTLTPGQPAKAGLYFKIDSGWHVYWKNAGDAGEPPHLRWTLPAGVTASALRFPAPKRLPLGPLMDFGYENEVLFPFDLNVDAKAKPGPAVLHTKADWLVCQATCIPGKAELEITRPVSAAAGKTEPSADDAALISRWEALVPGPAPAGVRALFQQTKDGFRLGVETGERESNAQFFPADQNVIDNPSPQKATPTTKGVVLALKKDANLQTSLAKLDGVLELAGGRAYEIAATPGTVAEPEPGFASFTLARIAGLAFLGGLLLNLMPCVFPVLFIKGLSLVQAGHAERQKLRLHGFVYTLGILVSFWALVGVLLALRAAGSVLGWGFQFQSPAFLALMAGLLFFLGLSLAGQFEIGLSLTSAGGSLAAKRSFAGSFFTGVLAVIVATPCTAPFMGAAVGYALSQSTVVTFAVFTALALGLAAPYVLLTLQPAWTSLLPRPGAWMEVLKQATAIPVFGTVIWLAWVLANAYGAALLAALLASFLLLAVAGWFLGRWPAQTRATVVAGVIGLAVVAICVFAPGRLMVAAASASSSGSQGTWEPWSADAVAKYQTAGRPVFVDFTANWCLSCQVNERVALSRPEVQKAFGDANVALLRADWTQHDASIAQALIGLGRSGVPTYVLYTPGKDEPDVLPEVLTPGIVTEALSRLPHASTQNAALPGGQK